MNSTTMITIAAVGLSVACCVSYFVARLMDGGIRRCFHIRELHDKLLTGDCKIDDVSKPDLLSLRNPILTHVGIGGVGPSYWPSDEILCMVNSALEKMRTYKEQEK